MKKLLRRIVKNNKGLTLTELMVTTLILTLASSLMLTGIVTASDTYNKTVKAANAQVALSTTVTLLRNEIGPSSEVVKRINSGEDNNIYYRTGEGLWARITYSESGSTRGLIKEYVSGDPTDSSATLQIRTDTSGNALSYPLVSNAAITKPLRVSFSGWSTGGNSVMISNLRVYDESDPANSLAWVSKDGSVPLGIQLRFS